MSHVCKIELRITSLDALDDACKALGLELVRGQENYRWFGQFVGDAPLPEGFTEAELGHCEHAIRIPGDNHAYEIGLVKRRDGQTGYQLLWDYWGGGYGLVAKIGQNGERLKQEYAAAVASRTYSKLGYRVSRSVKADGRVVLEAKR